MELRAIHHVAVTVADLDRSIAFYCDTLGLPLTLEPTQWSEEDPQLDLAVGRSGGQIAIEMAPIQRAHANITAHRSKIFRVRNFGREGMNFSRTMPKCAPPFNPERQRQTVKMMTASTAMKL